VVLGELRRATGMTVLPVRIGDGLRLVADLHTPLGTDTYRFRDWRRLEPTLSELGRFLGPGDTFIDGGANIGLFTIIAAALVGRAGRVIAFEPAIEANGLLQDNVALNGFDWVDIYQAALADRSGMRDFVDLGRASGFSSFAPANADRGEVIVVPTLTLEVCVEHTDSVALVKLDLEGAEVEALSGGRTLLERGVPFLVEVEDAHLRRQGSSAAALRGMFADYQYTSRLLRDGPNVLFERG
jgi:FkbM family methyltransferase